ncbi:hypothetical protein NPIL_152511 [Nephila pilipes]|uniref:Uncharacterized protein n=1 Tax=Nephila pilipes TaxID=299642 RepID=A0A8X6TYS2_NEPPI|nr:hypothetical protein NPIL_152511 [Nephila pilipes]
MYDTPESERAIIINVIHWIRMFAGVGDGNIGEEYWFNLYIEKVEFRQEKLAQNSTAEERLEIIGFAVCWNYEPYHRFCRFCVLPRGVDQGLEDPDALTKYYLPGILHIILCEKIMPRGLDLDFVELLQELWSLIPNESKEFVKRCDIYEPIALIVDNGRSVLPTLKKYLYHNQ